MSELKARPRVKPVGGRWLTNTLGTGGADPPRGFNSFISYWRAQTGVANPACYAAGCPGAGTGGGHVKLAGSAVTALAKFDWWIVPACSRHNKRSSCGSYKAKPGVLAVSVEAGVGDRLRALPAEGKKLIAAFMGKHHL
ncbi:hypothetical protein Rsub_08065 [Raphidocelis subcapitata]|uniref:Uncharacterized protein n=1 Tax=Raphidocelis subcapitata TaxID=307507 RepID=A0A2V0PAG7_9CHLO|nr:hypothetical protein Rsub_08065 [Raphidocelis subcapitata]|eukprot:GBF95942.1 hypothetical protein Rsub_08065 [Raphidocelis subcapitata]